MIYKTIGWASITVSALLLGPSVVPGVMSVLASFTGLVVLAVSILSIKAGSTFYFKVTAIITAAGIFLVNDGLRLYEPLPQISWMNRISVYCAFLLNCLLANLYAKKAMRAREK